MVVEFVVVVVREYGAWKIRSAKFKGAGPNSQTSHVKLINDRQELDTAEEEMAAQANVVWCGAETLRDEVLGSVRSVCVVS